MTLLLANAEPVLLLSIYKPILFLVLAAVWARCLSVVDLDLGVLNLNRLMWNAGLFASGVGALFLWLLIPQFWAGFPLAILAMLGPLGGYVIFRNGKVEDPEKQWKISFSPMRNRMEKAKYDRAVRRALVNILQKDGSFAAPPAPNDPITPTHDFFQHIVDDALARHAERVDIVVNAQKAAINVMIDGVRYPSPAVEPPAVVGLIDYFKQYAKLDVTDRRKRQTGSITVVVPELGKHTLQITTYGSTRELVLIIITNAQSVTSIALKDLGLLEPQKQALLAAVKSNAGVIIVSSPAHHGQTTTLYDLIREHDPYTQSIVTLEEATPVELEGIRHTLLDHGSDAEMVLQKLTAIIRREAQVVMIGKVTDARVAQVAANAGEDSRIYVGLNLEDSFMALRGWVKAVGDAEKAGSVLRAIVGQRLLRRLCFNCRVAYQPDPAMLKKLNMSDKVQQLYKHSGQIANKHDTPEPCPVCKGIGYSGRIGVFEVMTFDDAARKLVAEGQLDQLRQYVRRQKMILMQEAALQHVVAGLTSISEITRVFAKEEAAKPAAPQNPAGPTSPEA